MRQHAPATIHVRVAGIPVHLEWRSLLLGALIPLLWLTRSDALPGVQLEALDLLSAALLGAALLALGGLAHEMGHALSARRLGVEPEGVRLGLLRRAVVFPGDLPFSRGPAVSFLVSVSGPLATLAYAGVWLLARPWVAEAPLLARLCELLVVTHLGLAYYNLLPLGRNDGHHALAAIASASAAAPAGRGPAWLRDLDRLALVASVTLTAAAVAAGALLMRIGVEEGYVVIGLGAVGFLCWAVAHLRERR